ncbi:DUF1403 family protein [Sedimentitalea todarodis]|uniref:DUF1403 family protein n=1 Tax=Sedimentitalea todarodis TaxID=1631240 RepID=A0ABU3VG66_9RHOB|nr:DUF1403 family protein [Sedimentitalea todarodis]MDU9005177.1 DUF1403 family protein [Sedimentitalea todarodis]
MKHQTKTRIEDRSTFPSLPVWAQSAPPRAPETVAFRSGASLSVLDAALRDPAAGVPLKLLANTLALRAATATSKLEGRLARECDIRDAFHLTPPGEARGPDGDLLAFWRDAARLRLGSTNWRTRLCEIGGVTDGADIDTWLDEAVHHAGAYGPLSGCARILRAVLSADDRAERLACLLSDVVLARALSWKAVLPTTAQRQTKAGLRALVADESAANVAVQARLLESVHETITLARELALRAAALTQIAPKLRSKASDAAIDLFLAQDAIAPSSMLSPTIHGTNIAMTDRAARRLCSRLVDLGVARELTGRSTFRLYGIGP